MYNGDIFKEIMRGEKGMYVEVEEDKELNKLFEF